MRRVLLRNENSAAGAVPVRGRQISDWQSWTPYAAVAWSLIYAALGVYWAVSGRGFPYSPETVSDGLAPVVGQFGPRLAWVVVMMAGMPAAALGAAMLRGVQSRALRPVFITGGALLAGLLLLLMADLKLLALFGYIPFVIFRLVTGAEIGFYLQEWTQWTTVHQLLCLIGGFLWLAATVSYARRSGGACRYCGRREGPEGWTSPHQAARWGRVAVSAAMLAPVFYALTRYAWALGIPLGMSEEYLRRGQESGEWVSGLFLATFGLVGVALMLGLVQRWGEVFPGWMIGLAGRRVPIALAVVPASIVSVLLVVSGLTLWSGYDQMIGSASASGLNFWIVVGPVALFPVWGVALAVATLGYYYRRRGSCRVCGRGESSEAGEPQMPAR